MRTWQPSFASGVVCSLLAGLCVHAAQQPKVEPPTQRTTVEYTSESFPYFSFDELKTLSLNQPIPPELDAKLDKVLRGVIVSRAGTASPQLPDRGKIGKVLRVADWNIERGEHFDQVDQTLLGSPELAAAIKTRAAGDAAIVNRLTSDDALLRASDILVLNEADLGVTRSGYRDVAKELADHLGMSYVFGTEFVEVDPLKLGTETITKEEVGGDEELEKELNADLKPDPARYKGLHGTTLLTTLPIDTVETVQLPVCHDWFTDELKQSALIEKGKRLGSDVIFLEKIDREIRRGGRMALIVRLKFAESPTGYITVVATHLENKCKPECRLTQMKMLLERVKTISDPVVLAGDLNTMGGDGSNLSVQYIVVKKVKDYRFWVRQALLFATPVPSLNILKYYKNYTDPTARDIKFLVENREAALFSNTQKMRFQDGDQFDFRGESERTVNGRGKRLADSNERAKKGFEYTFALPRDFKGLVGREKLDWIFVKPVNVCSGPGNGQLFAAYYGQTMRELDNVYPQQSADHYPLIADLRLTSDKPDEHCPAETTPSTKSDKFQ
jgi:endonuclease/exonuclease/phosphatase family metal-dependent hydrolase